MGLLEQADFLTQHKTLGKFIMIRQQIRRLQRTWSCLPMSKYSGKSLEMYFLGKTFQFGHDCRGKNELAIAYQNYEINETLSATN